MIQIKDYLSDGIEVIQTSRVSGMTTIERHLYTATETKKLFKELTARLTTKETP